MSRKNRMVVAWDGSGEFTRIQEAIDQVPADNREQVVIHIKPGVYHEKLVIEKPYVTLMGEGKDAEDTVITYDDSAWKTFPDGERYETFHSYTLFVGAVGFTAERLTIENSAGPGEQVGQAVAAYVDADRAVFRDCRLLGYQDTLCTGPLPDRPIDPNQPYFGGPRGRAPRIQGRQLYERCYIEGDIDFIFGSAAALFYHCSIHSRSLRQPAATYGWVTAASTPEHAKYGYVFRRCRLSGDAPPGSVYLGRPWRNHAHTVFIDCWLGAHIRPEGWDNWDKPESEHTVRYAEHGSYGPGAMGAQRVGWSRQLAESELRQYEPERMLGGSDGWRPLEGSE